MHLCPFLSRICERSGTSKSMGCSGSTQDNAHTLALVVLGLTEHTQGGHFVHMQYDKSVFVLLLQRLCLLTARRCVCALTSLTPEILTLAVQMRCSKSKCSQQIGCFRGIAGLMLLGKIAALHLRSIHRKM